MMPFLSATITGQKLCIDFAALKHACPKGIYVAPLPDEPLLWTGVMFVRKGQYANAILRFQIDFPPDYPQRPPIVSFLSDVFHPLVTPLTTYTHTVRDTGSETVSAADRDRLPPCGLSLRHGFPEWFEVGRDGVSNKDFNVARAEHEGASRAPVSHAGSAVLTVEVLQYLRAVFDTEAVLDTVPLEAAANTGAWHAWRSYRSKTAAGRASPNTTIASAMNGSNGERSSSPRQQPGGARRPGEWNWQGVWEDRVKKTVQASISDYTLYGNEKSDVICFSKTDAQTVADIVSSSGASVT